MPTDMQILAEQIRRDAEMAAQRQAADTARGAELTAQFMAAKRLPAMSAERAEALAGVAAAIQAGANVPAPKPVAEVADELDQEKEGETCDCAACGDLHPVDDMIKVIDSDGDEMYASENCLNDAATVWVVPDNQTRSEQRRGINWYHVYQLVYSGDGDTATRDYAEQYWYHSESADEWFTSYESSPEYEDEDEASGDIYDSDVDVVEIHGWPSATPRDALCFGVELEMECGGSRGELTERLGGRDGSDRRYILKSDGSLDNGIELVTGPYTLEYHQARLGWQQLTDAIGSYASGFDTSTAGMHIHINRAAMSGLTLGKLLVFINDKTNLPMVEGIAQRKANHWAQFITKKISDARFSDGSKYQSLNVRSNTVELRIFRSNLNPKRILKNIEFAHAAVSYCAQASMQELGWQSFWNWLRKPANRKQYGHLIDYGHVLVRDNLSTDTSEDR